MTAKELRQDTEPEVREFAYQSKEDLCPLSCRMYRLAFR